MGSERPRGGPSHGAPEPRYEIQLLIRSPRRTRREVGNVMPSALATLRLRDKKRSLQYWQVGGRLAAENPTGADARLAIPVKSIRGVGHETAGFKKEAA